MRVDAGLMGGLGEVPARIRELEAAGYDGAITAETAHDPFFPLLLAAEHSQKIELITVDRGRLRAQPDDAREPRRTT